MHEFEDVLGSLFDSLPKEEKRRIAEKMSKALFGDKMEHCQNIISAHYDKMNAALVAMDVPRPLAVYKPAELSLVVLMTYMYSEGYTKEKIKRFMDKVVDEKFDLVQRLGEKLKAEYRKKDGF